MNAFLAFLALVGGLCRLSLGLILALAMAGRVGAGGGPENIFLLVNANGASSMEVANHYIDLRHVPPNNVFYVRTPPKWNAVKAADFLAKILRPALAEIERRKLGDQIDQIVYSCEFPWYVDLTDAFSKTRLSPQQRPRASLTSATYFYHLLEQSDPKLMSLDNNYYLAPSQPGVTLTRAFRGSYQWAPDGRRVESGGAKYLLSTALGFVQPDCNTVAEILTYLKRAARADGKRPKGSFYYMQNDNVRSTVRDPGFGAAASELHTLGFAARIDRGVVPEGRKDILGLTTGSAQVPLGASGCRLMPGALVDNLTSAGAQLYPITRPKPQTRVTEYLRLGAAGASGTVIEPFAIAQKFPTPALHVHYAARRVDG